MTTAYTHAEIKQVIKKLITRLGKIVDDYQANKLADVWLTVEKSTKQDQESLIVGLFAEHNYAAKPSVSFAELVDGKAGQQPTIQSTGAQASSSEVLGFMVDLGVLELKQDPTGFYYQTLDPVALLQTLSDTDANRLLQRVLDMTILPSMEKVIACGAAKNAGIVLRAKPKLERELPKPKFTYLSAVLPDGGKLILNLGLVRFLVVDGEKDYEELNVYELIHAQSTSDNDELMLGAQNAEYFPVDYEDRAFAAFQKRLMSQTPGQPSGIPRFTYEDLAVANANAKYYGR